MDSVLSRLPTVMSAERRRRCIGRSGYDGSPSAAARSPTRRPSMMSPTTVSVVTRPGSGPAARIGYSSGSRSGFTPSTDSTRTSGPTLLAGTTATVSGASARSAEALRVTVSRPPGSPSCFHRVTPPSSNRPTCRWLRSAGGRRTCTAMTSGSVVGGSGSSVVGLGGGAEDDADVDGDGVGAGSLSAGLEQAASSSSTPTPAAALIPPR